MVDNRIVISKSLQYVALNTLHFGHPEINKLCSDEAIFWWPNMPEDIEKKSKTCSACLNAGTNLKFQIPQTNKSKIEPPKTTGEEIETDFTGKLHNKKLSTNQLILIAVDKNSRWPVAKMCLKIHGTLRNQENPVSTTFWTGTQIQTIQFEKLYFSGLQRPLGVHHPKLSR